MFCGAHLVISAQSIDFDGPHDTDRGVVCVSCVDDWCECFGDSLLFWHVFMEVFPMLYGSFVDIRGHSWGLGLGFEDYF